MIKPNFRTLLNLGKLKFFEQRSTYIEALESREIIDAKDFQALIKQEKNKKRYEIKRV